MRHLDQDSESNKMDDAILNCELVRQHINIENFRYEIYQVTYVSYLKWDEAIGEIVSMVWDKLHKLETIG